MPRKPRGEGVLAKLPADQQAELRQWLVVENATYAEARNRLEDRFQVKTSCTALGAFYQRSFVPIQPAPSPQKIILEVKIIAPENFEVETQGATPS